MDIASSIAVITVAALIHASFQLSVSVLTLLSGHTIGARRSRARLMHLTMSFILGAGTMTTLLLSFAIVAALKVFGGTAPEYIWAGVCGLMLGIALLIWIFYYRRGNGTMLWIPRSFARYLSERTKSTRTGAEAFGLGLSSVFGELLFIIAPVSITTLVLLQLPNYWSVVGALLYIVISLLPLITIWIMVSKEHSLSRFQKWRETNKYFLQFAAGAGLIALGLFVYVSQIISFMTIGA